MSNIQLKYTEDLDSHIKKETEILTHKLKSENNSVLIDCAITDFLLAIIKVTNKVTSFKFWLEMDENKEEGSD